MINPAKKERMQKSANHFWQEIRPRLEPRLKATIHPLELLQRNELVDAFDQVGIDAFTVNRGGHLQGLASRMQYTYTAEKNPNFSFRYALWDNSIKDWDHSHPSSSHSKAARSFSQASKHHEDAARHSRSGNHERAAHSAIQAKSHSSQGKKHARKAADKHTKRSGTPRNCLMEIKAIISSEIPRKSISPVSLST